MNKRYKIVKDKTDIQPDRETIRKHGEKGWNKLRSYMAKKQLLSIAKKAQSMFDQLPEDMPLDDWMESHIAQMDKMMDSVYDSFDYDQSKNQHDDLIDFKTDLHENLRDFLLSADVHQRPDVSSRFYDYGANPDGEESEDPNQYELPFSMEERPEIAQEIDDIKSILESMDALTDAALNKYSAISKRSISPYIQRQFEKAFKYFKEGYLRLMDL